MGIIYQGYISKLLVLLAYQFIRDKNMMLPDTFVLWVWIAYIVNVFLIHYCRGTLNITRNITRIYLNNKSGVNDKKIANKPYALLPHSTQYIGLLWIALRLFSFLWILLYQGLILGICAEILIFIILAILPVQYNSHLRNIYKHIGESESKKSKEIIKAGFDLGEVKSIFEKAINENINPHVWWLDIKGKNSKKDKN